MYRPVNPSWPVAAIFASLVILALGLPSSVSAGRPVWTERNTRAAIGTIVDGPAPGHPLLNAIRAELEALLSDEFNLSFPSGRQLSGDWTRQGAARALNELLAAGDVDVIITVGLLSSHEACRRRRLAKPVVASTIIEVDLQDFPRKKGTSGVHNLVYLDTFKSFERDVRLFRRMVDFHCLAVLVDGVIARGLPKLSLLVERTGRRLGCKILVVPVEPGRSIAPSLPEQVDAVFVTPLLRFDDQALQSIVDELLELDLPSFSWGGRKDVERGILASNRRVVDDDRIARRVALNVQSILLGEDAGGLKTALPGEERLFINMHTARRIAVYPPWSVLGDAELLHEDEAPSCRCDLRQAIEQALTASLRLKEEQSKLRSFSERVELARASQRLSASVFVDGGLIDSDRAKAAYGAHPERALTGGILLSRTLYSASARAAVLASLDQVTARRLRFESLKLDLVYETARAYFNLLRARAEENIRKNDLALARSNMDRARMRLAVGIADRSEPSRWTREIARAKSALFRSRSARLKARLAFNRLRERPMDENCRLEEVGLDTPGLFVSGKGFERFIRDPWSLGILQSFVIRRALSASPELGAIDAAIRAQEHLVRALRRSWNRPVVTMEAGVSRRLAKGGDGTDSPVVPGLPIDLPGVDDTDWRLGVRFALPLSTGGGRGAELRKARARLDALRIARKRMARQVEAEVRFAFLSTRASYPAIALTREAREAARRNLALVSDSYARGLVSIMNLLDAQNAVLVSEEAAADAVYDFLSDVMAVQRAAGAFNILKSPAELAAWHEALGTFFETARRKARERRDIDSERECTGSATSRDCSR